MRRSFCTSQHEVNHLNLASKLVLLCCVSPLTGCCVFRFEFCNLKPTVDLFSMFVQILPSVDHCWAQRNDFLLACVYVCVVKVRLFAAARPHKWSQSLGLHRGACRERLFKMCHVASCHYGTSWLLACVEKERGAFELILGVTKRHFFYHLLEDKRFSPIFWLHAADKVLALL